MTQYLIQSNSCFQSNCGVSSTTGSSLDSMFVFGNNNAENQDSNQKNLCLTSTCGSIGSNRLLVFANTTITDNTPHNLITALKNSNASMKKH